MKYHVLSGRQTFKLPTLGHVCLQSETFEPDYIIWDSEQYEYVNLQGDPIDYSEDFLSYSLKSSSDPTIT